MSFLQEKFLNEPAWRWMAFAICATIFLFVWGRVINLLAGGVSE